MTLTAHYQAIIEFKPMLCTGTVAIEYLLIGKLPDMNSTPPIWKIE